MIEATVLYISFRLKNGGRQVTEKHLLVNVKRGDVGMARPSLKSTETRDELSTMCQDACQHLMLHPYITASRTSSQN